MKTNNGREIASFSLLVNGQVRRYCYDGAPFVAVFRVEDYGYGSMAWVCIESGKVDPKGIELSRYNAANVMSIEWK